MKSQAKPAVSFGSWEGKVKESQRGEGGLRAVGEGPGAAEPREPRAHVAEELETNTTRRSDKVLYECTKTWNESEHKERSDWRMI